MKILAKYIKSYLPPDFLSPFMMVFESLADLFLSKLMYIIVDCGIFGDGAVLEFEAGSFILNIFFEKDAEYTSIQVIITVVIKMDDSNRRLKSGTGDDTRFYEHDGGSITADGINICSRSSQFVGIAI